MNAVGEEVGQAEDYEAEHQVREAGEQIHNVVGDESRRAVGNGSGENADKEIGHVDELYDDSIGRDFFNKRTFSCWKGVGPIEAGALPALISKILRMYCHIFAVRTQPKNMETYRA